MISILVPVYNWNIRDLAEELNRQISELETEIEVIFYDDFSSNKSLVECNQSIINQFGFTYYISDENKGIADALNFLFTLAKYDWLIYLDADVLPVKEFFLKEYLQLTRNKKEVFCGGLLYQDEEPSEGILRWKYGRKYEVQATEEANENPYLNFKTCNFLIHKSVLQKNKFKSDKKLYGGIDTLFGLSLKNIDVNVLFIENRVYHLGLESNKCFLNKTNLAIESMIRLYENQDNITENTRLVEFYLKLKKYKLVYLFRILFKKIRPFMYRNLISNNPSINIFQIYKLDLLLSKMNHK